MPDIMRTLLLLSLCGTVLAALLAVLRRLLKNRLPKALFYYLWLLVLLRLALPVALPVPGLELSLSEPAPAERATQIPAGQSAPAAGEPVPFDPEGVFTLQEGAVVTGSGLPLQDETAGTAWHRQAWDWLCRHVTVLWLTGAALHFLWFALSYLRFCRTLRADCAPLLEHEQALLDHLRGKRRVSAFRSPLAATPMLVGLLRPRILLPETAVSTRELECILRHELTHLRRRDLLFKWTAVAVTSFHWFNPFMPWLRREIDRCCELSCDEGVIRTMTEGQRQAYGETLLALAAVHALPRTVPATTLCEEKAQLKERLVGIMKHKKVTAAILLLSCLLALLIAGCGAVLGPALKKEQPSGPLTWEQQEPVLKDLLAWLEDNTQGEGQLELQYACQTEAPQTMGRLCTLGESYLYRMDTGAVGPVDGVYPDTAILGHVQAVRKAEGEVREVYTFFLTRGDAAKAAQPVAGLEQLAADYPGGKASGLSWWQENGRTLYIRVDFAEAGQGYCYEYCGVSGVSGVRTYENAAAQKASVPLTGLSGLLDSVTGWQQSHAGAHDGENYQLTLDTAAAERPGHPEGWDNVAVYDLTAGTLEPLEGPYTGSADYVGLSLLYPAENPRQWLYLIDGSGAGAAPDLAGQVAVLIRDGALENAFAETADSKGDPVLMVDMAVTLQKGDLVYVESQEGGACAVTVLAGEPPRARGTLDRSLLSAGAQELRRVNQVILQNTPVYAADGDGMPVDQRSGVAQVLERRGEDLLAELPGGEQAFWVKTADVTLTWPPTQNNGRLAFGKALWDIYQKGVLPDGSALDYNGMEAAQNNAFAITDIDGDGKEELLLLWDHAVMAGMECTVLGYDGEAVYAELSVFPSLRFYDNGAVEADWSHNQGLAGDFWPYDVYRYDEKSDTYRYAGGVDAWDRKREKTGFPAGVDADGDGMVYYLLPPDWAGQYEKAELVDGDAYERWRSGYFSGAQEQTVAFQQLTEENIAALSYPRPDAPVIQPVG